jgi:hypothetical protein
MDVIARKQRVGEANAALSQRGPQPGVQFEFAGSTPPHRRLGQAAVNPGVSRAAAAVSATAPPAARASRGAGHPARVPTARRNGTLLGPSRRETRFSRAFSMGDTGLEPGESRDTRRYDAVATISAAREP